MQRGCVILSLVLGACGGASSGSTAVGESAAFEPAAFLAEIGADAAPPLFTRPTGSVEELDAARRQARGADRRTASRDLAVALMFDSWEAELREARRLRRRAERTLDAAARGNRDAELTAQLDFVRLWMSWRAGSESRSTRLATRFTTRHRAAGTLTTLAYMIRGELALVDESYDDASEAFRYALGQLDTPLYAFALYRTAHAHGGDGDREQGLQALGEVERLGCDDDAHVLIRRVAAAAAGELETGLRRDPDGVLRPASCPEPTEAESEEETGWRPAE